MTETENRYAGSIPDVYHHYLVPLILDAYAKDLAERVDVPADGAVLETAGGTGVLTRYLLDTLPESTRVIATDINAAMLEVARTNSGHANNIEFREANGVDLPFDDNSFDAVVCQFGVMFFPDISLGYREAARALKPGGHFIFNVWDVLKKNTWSRAVREAAVALDPENPADFLKLPYAYHDVAEIREQLVAAGFDRIETEEFPKESQANSARDVALALAAGSPLATQLADRGIASDAIDRIEAELLREFGDGEISAPMQAIVINAKLPA